MKTPTAMTRCEVLDRLEGGEKAAPLSIEKWQRLYDLTQEEGSTRWEEACIDSATCSLCIRAKDDCDHCVLGQHHSCQGEDSAWFAAIDAHQNTDRVGFMAACKRMIAEIEEAERLYGERK